MAHRSFGLPTRRIVRIGVLGAFAAAALVVAAVPVPVAAAVCTGSAPSDFNGDGVSDAAIADGLVTNLAFGASLGQSVVHVVYGTPAGLVANPSGTALGDQYLTDSSDSYRTFGEALATGDFNHDGCSDLAVGDPEHFVGLLGGVSDGAVELFYGSTKGLATDPVVLSAHQLPAGDTQDDLENQFGSKLAVGDFNGDGLDDLAVGAPATNSGGVYVFPGGADLALAGWAQRIVRGDAVLPMTPSSPFLPDVSLAAGDFDGDGFSDLAVGAPLGNLQKGEVTVLRGSPALLTATGRATWSRDSPGIAGTAQVGDEFGSVLATGDFHGNGRVALAIGAPGDKVGSAAAAGSVTVIYSAGSTGLGSVGNQLWTQNTSGLGSVAEAAARFGSALAPGDFDGNGVSDLAIGASGASVAGAAGAGTVTVIPGSSFGLAQVGSSIWRQGGNGLPGVPQAGDHFGWSLVALRTTSATRDDLLVGVPEQRLNGHAAAGVAEFVPGSPTGLTGTGSAQWSADHPGILGSSCKKCRFAAAMA